VTDVERFNLWHICCLADRVNVSLYQAASALNANARWQEVISENMASSSIPGFKKQDISFAAVQAGLLSPTTAGSKANARPLLLPTPRNNINFSPGEIRRTDRNTDFAIDGTGFFEVQLPNGTNGYTRDGEFKVNAQGELVTKQGYLVLGEGGAIQLDRTGSVAVSVAPDGTVSQGGQIRGKLSVVSFNDPNLLTPAGGGLYTANDPALQTSDTKGTVRQGFLEGANTSTVMEMANLINVMRAYEANQRVVQLQDERMGRTISELGNPS
jgi:flagellar basal-body rod protein FlgF